MKMTRPKWIALVALLVVLAVAAVVALRGGKSEAPGKKDERAAGGKPALTVTTTAPQRVALPVRLSANGNIAAWQEASIGAEAGGLRITEVRVNVGDRVEKNQVLAVFATETLRADLGQARAALAEAEAAAADAAANAERARSLQTTGALSASQINQYFTVEKTAQARVQAARAAFDAQQVRLGQSQVVAPDAGVISARMATVGQVVGNGAELFRLIRQGRLEWRAEVTSSELGKLSPGTPATVTAASGAKLTGKVRVLGATVDPQSRSALVYVDVTPMSGPANASARAGMFARGEFELGNTAALTVPQAALVMREGFAYVMRVNPDQRVTQLKVQTGRIAGDRVEITEGLPADARVVASGGSFLQDGDLVRIAEAGNGGAVPTAAGASAPKRPASAASR